MLAIWSWLCSWVKNILQEDKICFIFCLAFTFVISCDFRWRRRACRKSSSELHEHTLRQVMRCLVACLLAPRSSPGITDGHAVLPLNEDKGGSINVDVFINAPSSVFICVWGRLRLIGRLLKLCSLIAATQCNARRRERWPAADTRVSLSCQRLWLLFFSTFSCSYIFKSKRR